MGRDRRETVLGFKVEDEELQALAALLTSIAALMGNMPAAGSGQQTYSGSTRGTAPPTANYGASPITANISGGGGPNPLATGGMPRLGNVLGGPGLGGSALGGVGAGPGFAVSGAVTLQISGTITIHAAGAVTVAGTAGTPAAPGAATPPPSGMGGGGAPSPASGPSGGGPTPPSPAPNVRPASAGANPYNPFGNVGDPNAAFGGGGVFQRMGLGLLMGHPTQYLGQSDEAYRIGAQYYIGGQIGNAANQLMQPLMNEANLMNRGLNRVTREDVEAQRWRGWTTVGGSVLGGLIGGIVTAGNPIGIGAGAAIGGSSIGFLGNYEADRLEREKAVRLTSENIEGAFGDRAGTLRGMVPRPGRRTNASLSLWEQFAQAFALGGDVRDSGSATGQFGDTTMVDSAKILAGIAPGALRNPVTMARMTNLSGRLNANFEQQVGGYLGGLLSNPILAQQVTALNNGDVSALSGGSAEFLGATGHLTAGMQGADLAGGGGQRVVDAYGRFVRRRAVTADMQSTLGLGQSEVSYLRETEGSAAAARRLRAPDFRNSLQVLSETAESAAREFEERARRATTEPDRIANIDEARKEREKSLAARQQIRTNAYQAAELDYSQTSTILGSRGEQAQIRLGRAQRTSLFDERSMGGLFDAVRDNLKDQIEASITEIRAMKAAGAPAEKLAPIYAAIARLEDDLDKQILQRFERKYADMALPAQTRGAIASSLMGAVTGTGQVFGPTMAAAQLGERQSTQAQLQIARTKYTDAIRQFGPESRQALEAGAEVAHWTTQATVQPFQQTAERFSGANQLAGATNNLFGGARQLILGDGRGSLAAMPATLGQINTAAHMEELARARLAEDKRNGAGPLIIAQDQSAVTSAQINRQQTNLSATDVQMPAAYDIEQLKARNKLQRMEQSYLEPGNMLDQYDKLYKGSLRRLSTIDAHENKLRESGVNITPAMAARFEKQREDARMEAFQYKNKMEEGWIDRLVSYSQGAPSFAMTARPTMAQAAQELENRHDLPEGMRQSRAFGFVSRRGYEYERGRGYTTAGKSTAEMFPGDLAQMALYGRKPGAQPTPKKGGLFGEPDDSAAGTIYGEAGTDEDGAASEGTQQDLLEEARKQTAILTQMMQYLMHGGGTGGMPGQVGANAHGFLGITTYTQEAAANRNRGDNQRPRQ